ncbi:MAG: hypothetical protein HY660_11740 [Armatimonadetes bacterium]|nr:hypothetical protein [Armatimonadota bacterium]
MVGRNCALEDYRKIKVPSFELSGEFVAYSSPDSTYAVTKRLVDAAEKSILIGIYDFTAGYVKELLIKAMRRGVKVSLMLDLDNRSGETEIYEELVESGCEGVPAPSCASQRARYFASSHEKVIVIDDTWTLVQSGNYSDNSIPQNEKDGGDPDEFVPGNRDMGVAVKSKPLAAFFEKVLRSDMKLELGAAGEEGATPGGMAEMEEIPLLEKAPAEPPAKLFASRRFNPTRQVKVTPILSPDNYMDTIPDLLESADKSIYIEQQYIRGHQEAIGELLSRIRAAMDRRPKLDVRVILAKPFPGKRFDKEAKAIKQFGKDFGLKLGTHVRILNPKHFVHCHNKLIIVDEQAVLISSQNWSDSAVVKNREAGLLLRYPEMARHYANIFETDWDTGVKTLRKTRPEFYGPEALGTGKVVPLNWGDYVEV